MSLEDNKRLIQRLMEEGHNRRDAGAMCVGCGRRRDIGLTARREGRAIVSQSAEASTDATAGSLDSPVEAWARRHQVCAR